MGIRHLIIENFQSHAHTEIELAPSLTVLVGESDTGKSAVIRALRWLLLNEPRGREFIRAGTTECRVTAILYDGTRITRERTPSRNRYLLLTSGGTEKVYEGFGNDLPWEITSQLGVTRVHLDDDLTVALNMAGQLEEPFLLSQPGSLKARTIGRIQSVHIIDSASRDTAQDIARLQREARHLDDQISSLDRELSEFEDLPQLQRKLENAGSMYQRAGDFKLLQANLRNLAAQMSTVTHQKGCHQEKLARLINLELAAEMLEKGIGANQEHITLSARAARLKYIRSEIKGLSPIIPLTRNLGLAGGLIGQGKELGNLFRQVFSCRRELFKINSEAKRQNFLCEHTRHIPTKRKQLANLEQSIIVYSQLKLRERKLTHIKREKDVLQRTIALCSYLPRAASKINNIEYLKSHLIELGLLASKHQNMLIRLDRGKIFLNESNSALKSMAREYGLVLQALGRCPTCLEPVSQDRIQKIILQLMKGVDDSDQKAAPGRN